MLKLMLELKAKFLLFYLPPEGFPIHFQTFVIQFHTFLVQFRPEKHTEHNCSWKKKKKSKQSQWYGPFWGGGGVEGGGVGSGST